MAGAGDGQQLPPLRDLTRRAASFLRMARLALTGAATPAQLLAGEGTGVGGHSCDPYYTSLSTDDDGDDDDTGRQPALWLDEDEAEADPLVAHDADGARTRGAAPPSENIRLVRDARAAGGGPSSKRQFQFPAFRPASVAAAAAEGSYEPLMMMPQLPRAAAKKRPANDAEAVDHPFGCDGRGRESSTLLLVSS